MINLSIEQNGDSRNAVYLLQSSDRVDNLTLGMLVNNRIPGVAHISPVQIGNDRFYKFDVSGKISMREYLGEFVKKEKLLRVFLKIAETILEAGEYMINPTSFILDENNIYVDENAVELAVICIPLLSVVNDGNICNFFKSVMFSAQFDLQENGDYVGKLITFLNPQTFTLTKFIDELRNMMGIQKEETEPVEEEPAEETEPVEEEPVEETKPEEEATVKEAEPVEEETVEEAEPEEETVEEAEAEEEETVEERESAEESNNKNVPYIVRNRTSQKVLIDKDEFVIGSEIDSVDYCINDNLAISRRHARIVRHENEYFVIDEDSKNHTYLNGVLVESGEENFVPHGATIRFANEDFEFRMHD